ncbi:MAG: hypothetical protein Kow0068_01290 [Marinilabiliales bacterium]
MSKNKSCSVSYELINSLLVFNEKDELIHVGSNIIDKLKENGIIQNEVNHSDIILTFSSILAEVRENTNPYVHKINNVVLEGFVFPSLNGFNTIIADKEKTNHIDCIERDLKERVKELECLYNISWELNVNENLDNALKNCVNHIIGGFQFSEDLSVNISLNKNNYTGGKQSEKIFKSFSEPIKYNNKTIGSITVNYHDNHTFLKEEYSLINEISGKISRAWEKFVRHKALIDREHVLKKKNEKLIELTRECSQSREKLRTFFSAINDIIIVIDENFNIVMSNKEDIGDTGKCYKKVFGFEKQCEFCPTANVFKTADSYVIEQKIDQEYYKLESYLIKSDENKVMQVLEVCRNISTQKQMELNMIQNYKLASLGKLVAGIAHEINNPNTFILGNIKIINEVFKDIMPILDEYIKNNPDKKIARLPYSVFRENIPVLIEDMQNGAIRMKKIVEGLRNFAKKDEGINNEIAHINKIIQNNLRVVENQVRKTAKIELDLEENIPPFIGNINKMEQVLLNLIINASQAIEHDNGIIKIITHYSEINNEVQILVQDNGKGMDNKTMMSIFDPFFTTKRDKGGTGLGLSITYGIIKELNGSIKVDSVPGKGTTFIVSIPAINQ